MNCCFFLLLSSTAQTIRFNIFGCKKCDNEEPCRNFQQNLQCVQQRSDNNRFPRLDVLTEAPQEKETGNRRSFLRSLGAGALQAATVSSTKEPPRRNLAPTSRCVPHKTQLLKKVREADDTNHSLATAMTPKVHINSDCIPCPRCAGICPTGALTLVKQEKGKKLSFSRDQCSGCLLCVQFCQRSALSMFCDYCG